MNDNAETLPILIVDDELDIREGSERILKRMGFNVTAAANGEEALDKFTNIKPVIVLLVLGTEKSRIRRRGRFGDIIIGFSAHTIGAGVPGRGYMLCHGGQEEYRNLAQVTARF